MAFIDELKRRLGVAPGVTERAKGILNLLPQIGKNVSGLAPVAQQQFAVKQAPQPQQPMYSELEKLALEPDDEKFMRGYGAMNQAPSVQPAQTPAQPVAPFVLPETVTAPTGVGVMGTPVAPQMPSWLNTEAQAALTGVGSTGAKTPMQRVEELRASYAGLPNVPVTGAPDARGTFVGGQQWNSGMRVGQDARRDVYDRSYNAAIGAGIDKKQAQEMANIDAIQSTIIPTEGPSGMRSPIVGTNSVTGASFVKGSQEDPAMQERLRRGEYSERFRAMEDAGGLRDLARVNMESWNKTAKEIGYERKAGEIDKLAGRIDQMKDGEAKKSAMERLEQKRTELRQKAEDSFTKNEELRGTARWAEREKQIDSFKQNKLLTSKEALAERAALRQEKKEADALKIEQDKVQIALTESLKGLEMLKGSVSEDAKRKASKLYDTAADAAAQVAGFKDADARGVALADAKMKLGGIEAMAGNDPQMTNVMMMFREDPEVFGKLVARWKQRESLGEDSVMAFKSAFKEFSGFEIK